MALPKLETPKHSCILPSNGQTVEFRPFLVGEQKMLLIAQESENQNDVIREMMRLIESCADDVEVKGAELKDGLLKVSLERIVPEEHFPRQNFKQGSPKGFFRGNF